MLAEVEFWDLFCSMLLSGAYSLCACGRRIREPQLLRALSIAQWKPMILMALTMLAEVEAWNLCLFDAAQWCLFALRVRASYMRV